MKKKISLPFFYFCYGLMMFAANLAHPITPTFFEMLKMPNYMFGLAFALMSLGGFVLSPMWSKLADKHGYLKIMAIGVAFYGVGQIWFSLSTSIISVVFARLFAGIFSAGMNVGAMLYLSNFFGKEKKGERITLGMAIQIASGSLGFFFGGYLGNIDTMLPFRLQPILCLLNAMLVYIFMQDSVTDKANSKINISEINPFKAFADVLQIMTPSLLVFYAMIALSVFSFTAFDTSFNYYIRNVYKLPSIYNGVIKGSIGILGLILNLSLNRYVAKKFPHRKVIILYYGITIFSILVLMLTRNLELFIVSALLYYTIDTMVKPIQQIIGTENSTIYGGYNSIIAMGMVSGSLSAGYLYVINPRLPFYASFIVMIISTALSIYNEKQYALTVNIN